MSLEEGKKYLPVQDETGTWILVTRGDTGSLGKQYALNTEGEPENIADDIDTEISTSILDSTIAVDDATVQLADNFIQDAQQQYETEEYEEVTINLKSGQPEFSDGHPLQPVDNLVRDSSAISELPSTRPQRITSGQKPLRYCNNSSTTLYDVMVVNLCHIGMSMLTTPTLPDTTHLMANATISHEEVLRRNPKWSKAIKGPAKTEWLAADQRERDLLLNCASPKLQLIPEGLEGVPKGCPVYPIKRHCKIKTGEAYKVRWVVLGNLDDYQGDTYAPTAARKVIWLIFALSILLAMITKYFDIKGAFTAEKPQRVVYVSIDGAVYLLLFSLYGLKDAAHIFNTGYPSISRTADTSKVSGTNAYSINGSQHVTLYF